MKKNLFKGIIFTLMVFFLASCAKSGAFFSYNPNSYRYVKADKENTGEASKEVKEDLTASAEKSVNTSDLNTPAKFVERANNAKPANTEKEAVAKDMSKKDIKKELRLKKKEVKKEIKAIKKATKSNADTNTLLLVIIAILLPPLAVALVRGIGGAFILNIILTLLFYIPGLIHALIIVLDDN